MIMAFAAIPPTDSNTRLRLRLETSPDPVRVSPRTGAANHCTLVLVADAPPHKPAKVDRVSIHLPVGAPPCTGPAYLTCDAGAVLATADPSDAWELLNPAGDGTFTFVRPAGVDPAVVGQAYWFKLSDIPVSTVVGTPVVEVTEQYGDPGDDDFSRTSARFEVSKFPPDFGPVIFRSSTSAVDPGGTATLSWEGPPARYWMLWADQRVDVTNAPGRTWPTPSLTTSTTFRLEVSTQSDGVTVSRSYFLPVDVLTPAVTLTGDNDRIRQGQSVSLSWTTSYVSTVTLVARRASGGVTPKETELTQPPPLSVTPSSTTDYRLKARTRAGGWIESTSFTVDVSEPAPAATSDLWLVRPDESGVVALTVLDGSTGFQTLHRAKTGFVASDLRRGTWRLAHRDNDYDGWIPDLVLLKTADTASGVVEQHVAYRASDPIFSFVVRSHTPFPLDWGPRGTWTTVGKIGVVLIQTQGTGSGKVELHRGGLGGVRVAQSVATRFGLDQGSLGVWTLADMTGTGAPLDLVLIKTSRTARGKVEVSVASKASGYQQGSTWQTGFDCDDAALGTWHLADMNPAKKPGQPPDLVFVRTEDTATGCTEIYYAEAQSGYQQIVGGYTGISAQSSPGTVWGVTRYYRQA